jgi:GNAT superfamily N-acetyltransferase
MKKIIRQAKLTEFSRVKAITKKAYSIPYKTNGLITTPHESENEKAQVLKKEVFILVAIVDNKIAGAVRYRFEGLNNLYFFKLAVLKTYRNKGIGASLINKLERVASQHNCKKVLLDCAREKKLDKYYEKLGFRVDKVEQRNKHCLVFMSKKI